MRDPSVYCRYLAVSSVCVKPFFPAKVLSFRCMYVYLLSRSGGWKKFEWFVKMLVVRLLAPFCALLLLQGKYIVRRLLFCWEIIVLSAPSPMCSQKVAFALAKLLEVYNHVRYIYVIELLNNKNYGFLAVWKRLMLNGWSSVHSIKN